MLIGMMVAATMTTAAPSPEAEALGQRLAATGALQTMLPMMAQQEAEALLTAHPELSPADRDRLRSLAASIAQRDGAAIRDGVGHQYATLLSLKDLKALVAFNEGAIATRYRAAMPRATMLGLAAVGKIDFKGSVAEQFCRETGKLCAGK